jgi:hypothetical protein
LAREKAKFGWFRNYGPVQTEFRNILQAGTALLDKIEEMKSGQVLELLADDVGERLQFSRRGERKAAQVVLGLQRFSR